MEEKEIAIIENSFGSGYIDCSDNSFDEEYQAFKKLYSEHKNIKQQNKELQETIQLFKDALICATNKAEESLDKLDEIREYCDLTRATDEPTLTKIKVCNYIISILDNKGE